MQPPIPSEQPKPSKWKSCRFSAIALVVLIFLAVWEVWNLFPRPLPPDVPRRITEERALPPHLQKLLNQARIHSGSGNCQEALAVLAPEVFRTLALGDPRTAQFNQALLAAYWELSSLSRPWEAETQCRRILSFDPDNLAAKLSLARLMPQTFPRLTERAGKIPKRELVELRRWLLSASEAEQLTPDQKSEVAYQLAAADTAIWIYEGFQSTPGSSGFAEREEALAICRDNAGERRFTQLRHDILYRVWSFKWLFSDYQSVEGQMTHYKDLQRKIQYLARQLR